jgi:hypothetical protein
VSSSGENLPIASAVIPSEHDGDNNHEEGEGLMARPQSSRNRNERRRSRERANARVHAPQHMRGATDFSRDPDILSPDWLLRTLREQRWISQPLLDTAELILTQVWGPARKPGDWVSAYLCFVTSRYVDIQPWLKQGTNASFWREMGFEGKPPYNTVYDNFVTIERTGIADLFEATAQRLIQHARRHEPRVGRHVDVDGCEAETHGAYVHDCKPGEGCPYETGEQEAPTRRTGRGGRGRHHLGESRRGAGVRPQREHSDRAKLDRQHENEQPPVTGERIEQGVDRIQVTEDGKLRVYTSSHHWYLQTDADAGRRLYEGQRGAKRFWCGYYKHVAEDNFLGAPVAVVISSASRQEYYIYPELMQAAINAIGEAPEAVMADKGFSVESVFRFNTERGIASIMPWRPNHQSDYGADAIEYDRHGIPRCKYCGAEGLFVRFAERPYPRLWFKCSLGATEQCRVEQTISCSKGWRALLPLWRDDPVYHQLKESHDTHERSHDLWRDRYRVGGDNRDTRPKRMGIGWQRLRAQAALLIEWLAICDHHGWFGSGRGAERGQVVPSGRGGARAHAGMMRSRAVAGVNRPYGEEAAVLFRKSRWRLPPSERGADANPPPS